MEPCRYCRLPVVPGAAVQTFSYWSAVPDVAHRACAGDGYRAEARACQELDADCNDCQSFVRGRQRGKGIWDGQCTNQNRAPRSHAQMRGAQVLAFPNFSSGHPCFVHRKASLMSETR